MWKSRAVEAQLRCGMARGACMAPSSCLADSTTFSRWERENEGSVDPGGDEACKALPEGGWRGRLSGGSEGGRSEIEP